MANAPTNAKSHDYRGPSSGGTATMDRMKDVATNVADKAKDLADDAKDKAGEVASYVGDKAEGATAAVGSGMKSLAGTIRDKSPNSGMMASASNAVANTLESGGRYLEEQGLKGIGEDLTNLIRRNPVPAILVGIGIGYLFARATSRS